MRVAVLAVAIMGGLASGEARSAPPAAPPPAAVLKELHARLLPVFQRHYPGVTAHLESDRMAFEHDTRTFFIHVPLKTGEWQEAHETKGPDRRGILCSIQLVPGQWGGQAMLPTTINDRYFETFIDAVPSPDDSQYLHVYLSYPDSVDHGFLKEFHESVNRAWGDDAAARRWKRQGASAP